MGSGVGGRAEYDAREGYLLRLGGGRGRRLIVSLPALANFALTAFSDIRLALRTLASCLR
jgi:hypothetical protein